MASNLSEVDPLIRDAAAKAVDAILQWLRDRDSKPQLLEQDEFVYLQLSLHRFPSSSSKPARVNPHLLPIPHSLFSDHHSASFCLFFDDRSASDSESASSAAFLDRARSLSIPLEAAIGLSSLRSDYRPFEGRRRLCDSHDLFFADRRIVPLLPRLIGKEFFRRKKAPLPLDLSRPGWPQQIRRCLDSAFFHPPSKGTCAVIKVGRASMTADEIVDNAMAVIKGAAERVPKGFANMRSILIKAAGSVALPIYQAVPHMGLKIAVAASAEDSLCLGDEHEQGEVFDATSDEEGDEKLSSQKKKKKKGRIHDEIVKYIDMDETGKDTKGKKQPTQKKSKKGSHEDSCDARIQGNGDLEVEESGGSVADRVIKKKMKKSKKEKADSKLNKGCEVEQAKIVEFPSPKKKDAKVDRIEKKIKKTKKLDGEIKKIKKSKVHWIAMSSFSFTIPVSSSD
ncbi:hypothetical protein Cni_G00155 [Canna indica]|uniref:Ribosomal protein L1 n=1 Tax=Canna indica TaxID=4628 RepID=A0AAQ3PZ17_9LILI|nr:hypothetical protein Cni_G00155 [Canna indica]